MNYNTLESIVKNAARKVFGARFENFDEWIVTCNPDEDIYVEGIDLGTSVELSFEPSTSPFNFFSSDVVFYVNAYPSFKEATPPACVQVFFGNSCLDIEAAEEAAEDFLNREPSDGWYIEDSFDEDCGLHLMRDLGFDFESDEDFADAVESAFIELCDRKLADKLRSFIHYFEA